MAAVTLPTLDWIATVIADALLFKIEQLVVCFVSIHDLLQDQPKPRRQPCSMTSGFALDAKTKSSKLLWTISCSMELCLLGLLVCFSLHSTCLRGHCCHEL